MTKKDTKSSQNTSSEKKVSAISNIVNNIKDKFNKLSRNAKAGIGVGAIAVLLAIIAVVQSLGSSSGGGLLNNNSFTVTVNSAEVVVPPYTSASSTTQYVAMNVTINNSSNESISFYQTDLILTDENDESYTPEYVSDYDGDFSTLSTATISSGKKKTGYVVYKIDKDATDFVLEAKVRTGSDYKEKSYTLELDDLEIEDNTETVLSLVKEYLNDVFFNGGSTAINASAVSTSDSDAAITLLAADTKSSDNKNSKQTLNDTTEEAKEQFYSRFKTALSNSFSYFTPSDSELETFISQYVAANAKRAEVTVTIESYLPTSATIKVSSKTIDLSAISTSNLISNYLSQTTGKSYTSDEAILEEAEKYIFDNLYTQYESASLTTTTSEDTISMSLSDNKWTVDSSDSENNYGYSNLEESMAGDYFY